MVEETLHCLPLKSGCNGIQFENETLTAVDKSLELNWELGTWKGLMGLQSDCVRVRHVCV